MRFSEGRACLTETRPHPFRPLLLLCGYFSISLSCVDAVVVRENVAQSREAGHGSLHSAAELEDHAELVRPRVLKFAKQGGFARSPAHLRRILRRTPQSLDVRDAGDGGDNVEIKNISLFFDAISLSRRVIPRFCSRGLSPASKIRDQYFKDALKKANMIFLVFDEVNGTRHHSLEALKGFALVTKAKELREYGFRMGHLFLHLICTAEGGGYGTQLMRSIVESAQEKGDFIALESLMEPFGFYRKHGFIFDKGIKDRTEGSEVNDISRFQNKEDDDVAFRVQALASAAAEKGPSGVTTEWTDMRFVLKMMDPACFKKHGNKAAACVFPRYGFCGSADTVLMTRLP